MAARGQDRAIGGEGQAVDLGFEAVEGQQLLGGERVPESDRAGLAGDRQAAAVGAEDQAEREVVLGGQGLESAPE